ncbi:hypothetical protein PGB90_006528 [Kerria lacca]
MSDTQSQEALNRSKRALLRSLMSNKNYIVALFKQTPSDSAVHQARALLDMYKEALTELKEVTNELLNFIDTEGKSESVIAGLEAEIQKKFLDSQLEFAEIRGQFSAFAAQLTQKETPSTSCKSFNSSLITESRYLKDWSINVLLFVRFGGSGKAII